MQPQHTEPEASVPFGDTTLEKWTSQRTVSATLRILADLIDNDKLQRAVITIQREDGKYSVGYVALSVDDESDAKLFSDPNSVYTATTTETKR